MIDVYVTAIDNNGDPLLTTKDNYEKYYKDEHKAVAVFVALDWKHAKAIYLAFLKNHNLTFEERKKLLDHSPAIV